MRRTLLLLSALLVLSAMLVPAAGAEEVRGQNQRYFMRWTAPDTGTDCGTDMYLSTRAGSDDVICTQVYATAVTNTFPGRDIADFTLDAKDNVTGRIDLGPAVTLTYGVAVVDVTVSVDATIPGTFGTQLGSETRQIVLTPATSDASFEFDFDTPDDLDGETVTDLSFSITIDGPQVVPWDFNLNGDSWFRVPFIKVTTE